MFYTYVENDFGICQFGKWDAFDSNNIISDSKQMIDFTLPFPRWISILSSLSKVFIVSQFTSQEDIVNALDFIKVCRNTAIFISVITPVKNKLRSDLTEVKMSSDIFLYVEDKYFENQTYIDPVSYAIHTLANSFDESIEGKPQYGDVTYAFLRSGSAELITFYVSALDFNKSDTFQFSEEISAKVYGKRLGYLFIKSSETNKSWRLGLMVDALRRASMGMLFASACSIFEPLPQKGAWVTAIVSELDNPNNSFTASVNITAY